jgi:hypothetical protein
MYTNCESDRIITAMITCIDLSVRRILAILRTLVVRSTLSDLITLS